MSKTIYNDIYEGNSEEAKLKYSFLVEGIHLKVLSAMSTNIGIFPLEDSFYVATYQTKKDGFNVIIEETNSINILNIIIKRESYDCQYLNDEQIPIVTKFLEENNCKFIIK